MRGFQAAGGNFNQHRGEQPRICVANQGERHGRIAPKLLFEMFRCCYSGEPTAKNNYLVTFSGRKIARGGTSGPRKYCASSRAAWDRIPNKKQDNTQQINPGKSA